MRLILATSSYPTYADEAADTGVFVRTIAAQLAYAQKVANYLVHPATRNNDGTLTDVDNMVQDDTVVGTTPFAMELSEFSGNAIYLEETITKTFQQAAHLEDPMTGLYHPASDESTTLCGAEP